MKIKLKISFWALTAFFLLKGVSLARIVAVTDELDTTVVIEKPEPPVPTVSYTPEPPVEMAPEVPETAKVAELPEMAAVPEKPTLIIPPLEWPRIQESKIETITAVWVHPEPDLKKRLLLPFFLTTSLDWPKITESTVKYVRTVWVHPEPRVWVGYLLTPPFQSPPLDFPEIIESELKQVAWVHPEPELKTELAFFHYPKTPALKLAEITESKIKIRKRRKKRPPLLVPLEIGRGLRVVKGTPRFSKIKRGYSKLTAKLKNDSKIDYATVRLKVTVIDWKGNEETFTEDVLYIDSFQANEEKEVTVIVYKDLSKIKTVSFSYTEGYRTDRMATDNNYNYQSKIKFAD